MTEIWIDAQLSPAIAAWINRTFSNVTAQSVRALGLRDAEDRVIYQAARAADVVIMTKDKDFISLLNRYGPPPDVLWVTSGNTTNQQMRELLSGSLREALAELRGSKSVVEIEDGS